MHQPELPGLRSPSAARAHTDLVRQPRSPRLLRLLAEHQKLLQQVARKRQQLARLEADVRAVASRVMPRLEPLVERKREMDREIHALFVELLVPGRLSKRARREVAGLYRTLQDEEVLSPESGGERSAAEDREAPPWMNSAAPEAPASKPERSGGTVREMFLRLATAMHPDRAQDEPERAARTEAMKEVNQAYEAGDLARLLELERSWAASLAPDSSDGDGERRCEFLARANQVLRHQLKALRQQGRELTDSMPGQMIKQFRRGPGGASAIDQFIAEGEQELAHLTAIRDHVRGFRDGKVSLAELLAGPLWPDVEGDIDELLVALAGAVEQTGPPRSPRSRRRRRR
jgi:hypothetical protein